MTGSLLALHEVEGLALVMLCNHRVVTRKHALHLLKEVRLIFSTVTLYVTDQVSALCYIPFYSTSSKEWGYAGFGLSVIISFLFNILRTNGPALSGLIDKSVKIVEIAS